jgi:hypothetical protein
VLLNQRFRPPKILITKITKPMKKLFSILLIGFMMLMVGCTPNDEPAAKPQLSLTKGTATEV